MSSESTRLIGVQQQTCVTVVPGSINVDDDDGPSVVTRVIRITQVRRIIAVNPIQPVQQDEAAGCCSVLFKLLISLVALTATVGVPVAMVVIGALHINDCPVQKYIPIYLMVGGSMVLALILLRLCCKCATGCGNDDNEPACFLCILFLVALFLMAWNIAGAVWTYPLSREVNTKDPDSPQYCHGLAYWSAYGVIAGYLALTGLLCCCGLCCNK